MAMRKNSTVVGVGVLAAVAVTYAFSNVSTAQAPARLPDVSGVWLGRGIQSLSPSDPQGRKRLGEEGDIPYTAWSIERMKTTRPATGPDQTLKETNDPSLRLADP